MTWERVPEDSPLRCQAVIPTKGQCLNMQVEGSDYCPAHGGNRAGAVAAKRQKRMYNIERYQQKLEAMADHPSLKSLHEEVAVLRMILESRLKQCNDDHDLMLHSQTISNLVAQIEKAVSSCTKLDTLLSRMLDQNQAMQWASEIVEIIQRYIKDSDVLNEISGQIVDSYERISSGVGVQEATDG